MPIRLFIRTSKVFKFVLIVFLFSMKHSYLTPWYLLTAKITKLLLMNELLQANLCMLDKNLVLTQNVLQKISIIALV